MTRHGKLLERILGREADTTIRFDELCFLPKRLGFESRTRGSHFTFRKAGIPDKINLQNDGPQAKPYQVRQVRAIILANGLHETGGAHGKSDVEALQNSKEAIELWIATAKEFGDPVPAPSMHAMKFR